MKSLVQFIKESNAAKVVKESNEDSKSFTFYFKGLENGKETIESLVNMASDKGIDHESTEDSFTITLTRELCSEHRDKVDGIQDVLQQFSDIIRKDSSNASSESHAQFTAKFERTVDDMVSFIDNAEDEGDNEEEDEKDDKKNDEE